MPSHVLHRQMHAPLPVVASGDGAWLIDQDGQRYLDASGGAAVSCLGHSHPKVIEAIKAQLDDMAYAHSAFFTNRPAEQLAARLSDRAPGGAWRVAFLSGGTEANEAALKLARQIHLERGDEERTRFIARNQSYHGASLAMMALAGNKARRKPYEAIFGDGLFDGVMRHIPACYAYRGRREDETEAEYGLRSAAALEAEIQATGPGRVAAFVAETVVGATIGAVAAAPGYFEEVRRICDGHGVFLILDEVMCGMGRTGTLFACEQEGIVPDMIVVAKGLGAGYQPIGAILVREELAQSIETGSGLLRQGHTYMTHATACAGANAVLQTIDDEGLLAKVRSGGERLIGLFRDRLGQHANIGDIRGRGYFIGVELVADRETKQPFPRSLSLADRIKKCAMANGLVCYPSNGTSDGTDGDHVLIAPPFIISDAEHEQLTDRLSKSIEQALTEAGVEGHGQAA